MGRRAFVGTLALLVMSGLVGGGQATAETKRVRTKFAETEYGYPDSLTGYLKPKVVHVRGIDIDLHPGRDVSVTHIDGATGATTPAGSDRTNAKGKFEIDPSVTPQPGDKWKIVVPREVYRKSGHKVIARAARTTIPA